MVPVKDTVEPGYVRDMHYICELTEEEVVLLHDIIRGSRGGVLELQEVSANYLMCRFPLGTLP